jgi:NAD-dependent dihydropyrimidine dehydrogenase PreA subunit
MIKITRADVSTINTLRYDPARCVNCGLCSIVCPQGCFEPGETVARLVRPEACMECGACQTNCPTEAITEESGVGCAAALIYAALTGKKASCGCGCGESCCGT